MTSLKHSARKALVGLASTLLFAGAASAVEGAPSDDPAAGAPAVMLELDEIWVHGERLAARIEAAEDDFFRHYNALNEDDRFDVVCGLSSSQPGSMILQRTCVPGFLAGYAHVRPIRAVHYGPTRLEPTTTCHGPVTVTHGSTHFFERGGCSVTGMAPSRAFSSSAFGSAMATNVPVPAELRALALHHRDQYADSVRTAIAQHPELADKAAHLAGLYSELEATQQHYRDTKAAMPLAWSFERRKGAPGPRGR